jgi:uncharacterized MAPEG superfamily protein
MTKSWGRREFMTVELEMLTLSVVLGLVQIVVAAHAASRQYGYRWAASARDAWMPPLAGFAARLERAQRNFMETFPLFAAAVLIAHLAGRHGRMTALGAQLYFWGRVAYAPLYAFGVPLVRSLIWNVATIGIVMVLLALL